MRAILFRPRIVAFLLFVVLLMSSLSVFFFTRLDYVVHNELYKYGLQFSYEWAGHYWMNSTLTLSYIWVAVLMVCVSIVLTLLQVRHPEGVSARLVTGVILLVGITMFALSVFFFTRLDYVVHNELYKYGLQFSYEWAGHYWTYSRLMLDVLSFAIIASITSIVLIFSSRSAPRTQLLLGPHRVRTRISAAKLACTVLASAGVVAIALAVYLDSSILAFIGIGLIFSAVALFYIRSESYIKETLLDKTTFPSLANLGQMMEELGYEGKGVYLPPEYFKGFESSKVYVTTRKNLQLPPPEKTLEGDKIFIDNPNGALLIPPGIELKRLFEKTMGTSFTRIDLQYFKRNMPKLLVEDLEIAQEVEIETNKDRVFFITKNSVYRRICKEVQKLPIVYGSLGCPLCSAIACAIAETTGKLVAVERILIGDDGQTTSVEYSLSEPKREPSRK